MTNRVQSLRSSVAGNRPTGRLPGELYVNWPDGQFGVINAANNPQDLIAVRFFSTGANYNVGDHVLQGGSLYKAVVAVSAGAFNIAQWVLVGSSNITMGDTPPINPQIGSLWWDSVGGNLYVWYNDGNSSQWVIAVNTSSSAMTVIGDIPPANPAVGTLWFDSLGQQLYCWYNDGNTSQWVPTTNQLGAGYLPLTGGTLTGTLNGTNANFPMGVAANQFATLSGTGQGTIIINRGAAANPVLYLNDGSANRTSLYFDVANNRTTLADNSSGVTVTMNAASGFNVTGSNINCSGYIVAASPFIGPGINCRAASNPIVNFQNAAGSTTWGQVYCTGTGSMLVGNTFGGGTSCTMTMNGDITMSCGTGHNFIVNPGVGYQTGGGSWAALSDSRIKTVERDYKLGLDEVLKLRPIVYRYKGNDALEKDGPSMNADTKKLFVGLVAQEAEMIFPNMVEKREGFIDGKKVNDLRAFNNSELIYALVNAVKTLTARVEELEAGR